MTDDGILPLPLLDREARDRIAHDLDENLLVEAGAGSGKTTELVARMTALVASGQADIEQIAAVTFTRKAAGELRQRFQMRLEEVLREARATKEPDTAVVDRLATGLQDIDRAFVGTIHSFCAKLLRERPLEIGLDPGFQELPVEERDGLRDRFWGSYLERLTRDSDPILEELSTAGIRPTLLTGAFLHLVDNPDVDFPAEDVDPPTAAEIAPIRAELESIVENGWELMPARTPLRGWDPVQTKIRTLHFTRDVTGWKERADFFDGLALVCKRGKTPHKVTQNRWREAALAKAFCERLNTFGHGDTPAQRLLEQWYAHRYALAIRLVRHAAAEFQAHRLRMGRLDFQDLLVLTARLLRENPGVRRQLGERYRHVLVDEFQDTDPLQAEIVLLLASEPAAVTVSVPDEGSAEPPEPADWREAIPRPGALFVVGDPKQSIYRFRRADIQLYGFVKDRFADFGTVVELTSNFRSRPPIGDLVNDVFESDDFFPAEPTEEQAPFERLNTRPGRTAAVREGVFFYELEPEDKKRVSVAGDDASRIATWIRDRVDAGERTPGDFLILTRRRNQLSTYARALESHSIPVQVTGAGIGAEMEIDELQVILECMIDPANPVKVIAALVGLFFGIDYEQLVSHREEGGGLDVMQPGTTGDPEVLEALRSLHRWWRAQVNQPADIFVGRLVNALGLLPYAAAGDLGSLRAGALVYALDAVRASALAGDASLPGALAALQSALALSEAEAPLEPGLPDVVRLMNLHQAKGLEGNVVILADPSGGSDPKPDIHTERDEDGTAAGFIRVTEPRAGWGGDRVMAKPAGWEAKEARELLFEEAEEVRLGYVAVTRAREELVVARWAGVKKSPWGFTHDWLDEHAEALELLPREPAARERLELTAEQAADEATVAKERLAEMAVPGFRRSSVTAVAKGEITPPAPARGSPDAEAAASYRGLSWGSAVHGALAAAALAGSTDEGLRATCRDLLVEHERPLDDHGEPTELAELLELVTTVRASSLWERALASKRYLVEVPFATPIEDDPSAPTPREPVEEVAPGRPQLDLFGAAPAPEPEVEPPPPSGPDPRAEPGLRVLEGVIDLVFHESDGWVVADYKTDLGTDPEFGARTETYRRQVDLYARAWADLTGQRVKERVLFYTTMGRVESW